MTALSFSTYRHQSKRLLIQSIFFLMGLILLGVFFSMLINFLAWASELHWLAGLGLAISVFLGGFWALWWIRNTPRTSVEFGIYPATGLLLNLLGVVLVEMVAMASLSEIFYRNGWVFYSSPKPISVGLLLDFYGWHFIDSIPVLDIWKAFDVSAPAKGQDSVAQSLVLLFRVAIVGASVALYQGKAGRFRDQLCRGSRSAGWGVLEIRSA